MEREADGGRIRLQQQGPLTEREAEAVLWTAAGKTAWEAGGILGTAEKTANAHVYNAAQKLGAVNRAHLVARAFVVGILEAAKNEAESLLVACLIGLATIHSPMDARRPPTRPIAKVSRPGNVRRQSRQVQPKR